MVLPEDQDLEEGGEDKMRKYLYDNRKKLFQIICCTFLCYLMIMTPLRVLADDGAGLQQLQEELNLFKELVASLVSAIGSVVLMWAVFKMGMAMQSGGNGGMEAQSLGAIGGGVLMIAAPQLVLIFTSSPV